MRVDEVMNKAIAVEYDLSLKKAAKIMSKQNIGSLIVLKKDKIVGILTDTDIIRHIGSLNKKVSSVMAKKVVTIDIGESIDNASLIMAKNKIKRLPVLEKGKLIGIITATDIVANSDLLNEDFLFD